MKNPFILFENIIYGELCAFDKKFKDQLNDEILIIKRSVKEHVYKLQTKQEIESYIQKYQHEILNLSFELYNRYRIDLGIKDHEIPTLAYTSLEELLCFLESNYLKYLDKNAPIPVQSVFLNSLKIAEKLALIKSTFSSTNICPDLLRVVYVPFIQISSHNLIERISYNNLNYIKEYINSFHEELELNNSKITNEKIIDILYSLNFNSLELLEYKVNFINKKLLIFESEMQRVDYLFYCLKTINQKQSKSQLVYDSDLPSAKFQITTWIEEEITYRERNIEIDTVKLSNDPISTSQTKLATGLSVSQLAYFYKLLVDTGVVLHKNQRDIFRHISECYSTSKVSQISLESISNKYYAVESGSVIAIREYLIEMLNITKDFL